jgi:large subunit ribosomal protein L10
MPSQKKIETVKDLETKLRASQLVIATGFRGLTVPQLSRLRRELRAKGVEYRVVKNTLARRAAEAAGKPGLAQLCNGPIALAFSSGELATAPKAMVDFVRSTRLPLEIAGGLLDSRVLKPAEVERLATMPPKNAAVAQLLGGLQGPLAGLAGSLQALLQNLAYTLQARKEQLEGAGPAK